jgi:alanine dehydrogenase
MQVGLLKEIKNNENRVALTPEGVRILADAGHRVLVERGAGINSGFSDEDYAKAGAQLTKAAEAWASDLILKVKEPLENEFRHFAEGQIIFTYFHLAGVDRGLTRALLEARVTAIAYETVRGPDGRLPLLAPMSAVAGKPRLTARDQYRIILADIFPRYQAEPLRRGRCGDQPVHPAIDMLDHVAARRGSHRN